MDGSTECRCGKNGRYLIWTSWQHYVYGEVAVVNLSMLGPDALSEGYRLGVITE